MIFKRKKFIHHFSVYFLFYVKKKYEINNSSTYNIIMIIELVLLLLWKNELHWKLHVCYDLASLGQLAGDQKIEVAIVQIIMFWPKPAQFERRNSAAKPLVLDNSLFSCNEVFFLDTLPFFLRTTKLPVKGLGQREILVVTFCFFRPCSFSLVKVAAAHHCFKSKKYGYQGIPLIPYK